MAEGPAIDLRNKIRKFIQDAFPAAASGSVTDETSLLEEGIVDSMGIISIVTFIEDEFGVSVSDDDLIGENFESIAALHAFVERES